MSDIRVAAPDKGGCQAIQLDGRSYPVKDGYARIEGRHADELKVSDGVNYLPGVLCSLSRTNLAETYCPGCKKKYLALFGENCQFCGGKRTAL